MECNNCPPELRSVNQHLTPPESKPCASEHPHNLFFFYGSLTTLRVSAKGDSHPIEYVAFSFPVPVRCVRDAFFSYQHLSFLGAQSLLPFQYSADGFSCDTPNVPNHMKLMSSEIESIPHSL
jgi:hypothetical protein